MKACRIRIIQNYPVANFFLILIIVFSFFNPQIIRANPANGAQEGNPQTNGVRKSLDMNNLGKAWQEYVAAPGPETANKVYMVLPEALEPVELDTTLRPIITKDLHLLERQIYAGERNSLKMAFRLFSISDTEMQNELYKIIGYLLRYNTKLFLEELQNHESYVPDLDTLVTSYKLSNPDEAAQQKLEFNIRMKALSYIEEKALKSIKKKCTKILKKYAPQ